MGQSILEYTKTTLNTVSATGVLAVFAVTPLGRWSLGEWNSALSVLSGCGEHWENYRGIGERLAYLAHYDTPPVQRRKKGVE